MKGLQNLGFEGWALGIAGLAGIVLTIASFFGYWPFSHEQTSQILIGASGAIILAVVSLSARRQAEISELKKALGIADAKLLNSSKEFGQHLASTVVKAESFVLDCYLTSVIPEFTKSVSEKYYTGSQGEYTQKLSEKVHKGKLKFYYVGVIFHQQSLENKIFRLLLHEGDKYYMCHYDPPPNPIPVINLMSFDNESFYLGGFHIRGVSSEEQVLYIREPHLTEVLKDYWKVLYANATPLNAGGEIKWGEIERIASRLGMTKPEYEDMLRKIKEEVQREKRRLKW